MPDPVLHCGWQNWGRAMPVFKVIHAQWRGDKIYSQMTINKAEDPKCFERESPVSGDVTGAPPWDRASTLCAMRGGYSAARSWLLSADWSCCVWEGITAPDVL